MRDPRIDRLLLRIEETTPRGAPTRVAEIAARVQSLLVEIEKLRSEVEVANRQVVALAARETSLRRALSPGASDGALLTDGANALAPDAVADRSLMDEPELEFQRERHETVSANLNSRRQFVQRTQDLLATRINTVQRQLDRFVRAEEGGGEVRTRRRRRIVRRRRRR